MLDSTPRRPRAPWLWLAGLAALAVLVPVRIVAQVDRATHPARGHSGPTTKGEESYVLLSKGGDVTLSGSTDDVDRARRLAGPGGEVLWFRRGGREFAVRDPALLAQAGEIFAPQQALGAQQGELGKRQGELGARQGKLGAKQGELGARLGSINAGWSSASESERRRLEREEQDLSREMDDLGHQQAELGKQQQELGRQQEQLGREQERLAREAAAKLKTLLDDAVTRGLAQEVR